MEMTRIIVYLIGAIVVCIAELMISRHFRKKK